MNLKGLRTQFYTKEEVVDFLVKCIDATYKNELSYDEIFAEFPKIGFRIRSMSNNSIDCKYWGQRIRIQTAYRKNLIVPVDITYYPK
jgi:hypothetical protein